MSRSWMLAAAALAFSSASTLTFDTAEAWSPRVRGACTGDARRLCPQYKLGSAEMRYCMESKGQSISIGCIRSLQDEGVIPRSYRR